MTAYGSYIVETFATLFAVCAIAFVVLYGARRLGVGKARGGIELVGQLPLDARRGIYLVKVADRVLVVGVGEGGFTKLAELPESSLPPEDAHAKHDPIGALASRFSDVLRRTRGRDGDGDARKGATRPPPESGDPS